MNISNTEEEIIFSKLTEGTGKAERKPASAEKTEGNGNLMENPQSQKTNEYFAEITQRIEVMNANWISQPDYAMVRPPLYRPVKMARYVAKRMIRKSLNWALDPTFEKQTQFN